MSPCWLHLKPKLEGVLASALTSGKFKAIALAAVQFNLEETMKPPPR